MKKIKIIFSFFLVCTMILISTNAAYAWFSYNKTSYVVGCEYDDIDTTQDADNAHEAYTSMGLSYSKKVTSPTLNNIKGSHANGKAYLNSGIVLLSGHGNNRQMIFETSSNSDIFINMNTTVSGVDVGIGHYIDSSNALIIFAGCETAKGSSNISSYAVNQGAITSLGWTESAATGSFTNWTKRFNKKIKDKTTTVAQAKSSADGHIYIDSRIKNGKIYGKKDVNPWYYMNAGVSVTTSTLPLNTTSIYDDNEHLITTRSSSTQEALETAEKYIIKNLDTSFNKSDYVLEINGADTKYYDYILYINGVRTNYGYTIAIEKNGETRVYDNMKNISKTSIVEQVSTKFEQCKKTNVSFSKQKAISDYPNCKITPYMSTFFYDENDGNLYNVDIYDVKFEDGTLTSVEYRSKM